MTTRSPFGCKLLPIALAVTALLNLGACSDEETVTIKVETKQKPKLDVLGVNQQPQLPSVETLMNNGTKAFFQMRPQYAALSGLKSSQTLVVTQDKLDNFAPDVNDDYRQYMREQAVLLLKHEPFADKKAESSRLIMANIFLHLAGSEKHKQGFIEGYFGHQPYIINQINGPLVDIIYRFSDAFEINSSADVKSYLSLLKEVPAQVQQIKAKFIRDAKSGWVPPKSLMVSSINFLQGFSLVEPKDHIVYRRLKQLMAQSNIDKAEQKRLLQQTADTLNEHVFPAYQKVIDTMTEYLPQAAPGDGIWAQPGGKTFYTFAIKDQADSDFSADEIHKIGLDEVARISADMDSILSQLGYKYGTISERMAALAHESRFSYENNDKGREKIIADLTGYIEKINKRMPEQFKTPIKYDVIVKPFAKEIEDTASGGQYYPPFPDGSKPGVFLVNLRDIPSIAKFDLPSLTYHETNPGHHWQASLNMDIANIPALRSLAPYNSYVEGWALYSELVAYEMGMYDDDAYGNLGRLKQELFRSVRLVVDTGIHAKRWTREKAITYMMEHAGSAESEATAEVERYMAWPGQALGYKLGMMKIVELRKQAQKLLGPNFDIAEFHDVVLLSGALPLDMLEQNVNDWIASK
ncbi:DUF885 domain-containing protein [Thalassotalea sp. HSM 43]|uniref:DUF885 domain-containing protein n=1 Tax=Thalassotalea sp. HSM 43 TaxID=2552945 RepID=UPI0010802306|nr:DUF885 domain-containing protein [Thalassotalea sp. HSM 43]QBY02967.1 DUF885 domain-containing protein [Thalassotalea sp. HSM 43]